MAAEGNVADTGILEEAHQLIQSGSAITICEALEILMQNARRNSDSVKMLKIKKTQKSKDCRRRRRQ